MYTRRLRAAEACQTDEIAAEEGGERSALQGMCHVITWATVYNQKIYADIL